MTLDWDFFFDDWLIDRVPDSMEIRIEQHPNGIFINPPELTCYFGANPIYLYGEGKLQHEVMMAPSGFTMYPEFLQRPGFEFVEEMSFFVDFTEDKDFHGNDVENMHVGMVNAKRYLDGIFTNIYGTASGYAGIRMPSSDLRRLNSDDYAAQGQLTSSFQIYDSIQSMIDDGCEFYTTMGIDDGDARLLEYINDTRMTITSPGAIIQTPGVYGRVIFLRYSHVTLPTYVQDTLAKDNFQIFITTEIDFRYGTILDMGSTSYSNYDNYGFRVDIGTDGVSIVANNIELNQLFFSYNFDFRFSHKIMIMKKLNVISVVINGLSLGFQKLEGAGNIVFAAGTVGRISYNESADKNVPTGDIENLAIFSPEMNPDTVEKFFKEESPFMDRRGTSAIIFDNIPVSLSYDLTYVNPIRMYVPNFFRTEFKKIYLIDESENIEIIDGADVKDSIIVPNGFKIDNISTTNMQYGIDYVFSQSMPALTKLTSDTHVPLRFYMKFKIPEDWWSKKTTYSIRLVLAPVSKMLRYVYKKYKTGEFV